MSLHEPTHGRRRDSPGDGDLDVPNGAGQNGPWLHRQMDGQKQRADRPDDRPKTALSDLGTDASRSDPDPEQSSASAYRSKEVADDDDPEAAVTTVESAVVVRPSTDDSESADDRDRETTKRYDGMQSHLGRCPERVSRVEGCAVSDVVAYRRRSTDQTTDRSEPDPCVAQASGYLARD